MSKIQVYITTYTVPFDQTVKAIGSFNTEAEAVAFINEQAAQWWLEHEGDRAVAEGRGEAYEPVSELGYDMARIELWGGEQLFHAMLDADTYARLHEAHYAREFDAQGIERPGYLINAYAAGQKPGGSTAEEVAEYDAKAKDGLKAVMDYYSKPN